MQFENLVPATLIKRYKRFMADVRLDSGEEVTIHCPNPGAMLGLRDPETPIWIEPAQNPKRKLKWTWMFSDINGILVGINTQIPNPLAISATKQGVFHELKGYETLKPEVKYGENSRIDILLDDPEKGQCYVEIKNVHLCRKQGLAEFPDSVTARGAKHLGELSNMVANGHRAVMLYIVQRGDCGQFAIAGDIDPTYIEAFEKARSSGVEMLAYGVDIEIEGNIATMEKWQQLEIIT